MLAHLINMKTKVLAPCRLLQKNWSIIAATGTAYCLQTLVAITRAESLASDVHFHTRIVR